MSLKQRAVQCSAHIPPSQYVPVYSRPQRTRRHEELSPITPKPNFEETEAGRTQHIQEAVKQWLESSPKSVIGMQYRTQSPSTGSPTSHDSSALQAAGKAPQSHNQTGLEKNDSRAGDAGTAAQKGEGRRGEEGVGHDADATQEGGTLRWSSRGKDRESSVLPNDGPSIMNARSRRRKKGHGKDFISPDHIQMLEMESSSDDSDIVDLREFSSGRLSREFDCVLAAAAIASEAAEEINPLRVSDVTAAGSPQVLLKPPRGLETPVVHEDDQKSAPNGEIAANGIVSGSKAAKGVNVSIHSPEIEERTMNGTVDSGNKKGLPAVAHSAESRRLRGEGSSRNYGAGAPSASRRSATSPTSLRTLMRNESLEESARYKSIEFPGGASNRTASSLESRPDASRRRSQPSYHSEGTFMTAKTHQSPMYELPHGEKTPRSARYTAVTPEDSQRLKNAKVKDRHANPAKEALEQARWNKQQAQVAAWEEARMASVIKSYKREESKIQVWEQQKVARATVALSKLEMEFEKRRVLATKRMEHEVAEAHRRAKERRSNAEVKRGDRVAKTAMRAQICRVAGKSPMTCFCF